MHGNAPMPDADDRRDSSVDSSLVDAYTPVDAATTISRRQMSTPAIFDGATASLSATWPSPTINGNVLVACMGLRWAGAIAVTPPAGWQQAVDASPQSGESRVRIWYIPSAASRAGSESWTFTSGVTYQVSLAMFEYAGLTALDKTASSTGTSTMISTGTTAPTSAANELWFACADATGAYPQAAPSNGFSTLAASLVGTTQSGLSAAWFEKIVSAQGTASTSTSISTSREWSAAMVTFR